MVKEVMKRLTIVIVMIIVQVLVQASNPTFSSLSPYLPPILTLFSPPPPLLSLYAHHDTKS